MNAFLSSGRSAIFWRLSWTCSKGSDPGYWFPAWLQQARGVGSPALNNKKTAKSVSDLTLCTNVEIFYIWNLSATKWCLTKSSTIQISNRLAVGICLPVSFLFSFIPPLRAGMSGVLNDLHTGSAWSAFTQTLCHGVLAQKPYMFTKHAHRAYFSRAGIPEHTGAPLLNPQWNPPMLFPAPFLIVNRLAHITTTAPLIPPQIITSQSWFTEAVKPFKVQCNLSLGIVKTVSAISVLHYP